MNKPVYLGLSILKISKTLMYEFCYDCMKPKYQSNANLCYVDTGSFIIHITTEVFYEDIADKVKKRFDASKYKLDGILLIGKNEKIIGLIKGELGGKIMIEFVALESKTYSYLMDDGGSDRKDKGTKKCVIKRIIKFIDYKHCLFKNEIILKLQERLNSEAHNVYTEEMNKIARCSNDDKRLQTFDNITSYSYRTNSF